MFESRVQPSSDGNSEYMRAQAGWPSLPTYFSPM